MDILTVLQERIDKNANSRTEIGQDILDEITEENATLRRKCGDFGAEAVRLREEIDALSAKQKGDLLSLLIDAATKAAALGDVCFSILFERGEITFNCGKTSADELVEMDG